MDSDATPLSSAGLPPTAGDSSMDFEKEKFSFEREKLEFERLRFAAEQAKRDKEIEKLDEEIREFRRPLWRKSSSFGALATITVAVIAGCLTFGTDVFKSNIGSLISDRSKLQIAVADLTTKENSLKANTDQLLHQKNTLTKDKEALVDNQSKLIVQRDALVRRTDSLRLQQKKLEHDVLLAPVKTRLSLLEPKNEFALGSFSLFGPAGPSDESILSLTQFGAAHRNDPNVSDLFQRAFKEAQLNTTKAAIALILFGSTGELKWREMIKKLAIDDTEPTAGNYALSYYLHLLSSSEMSLIDDKPEILKALYLKLTSNPVAEKQEPGSSTSTELKRIQKELSRMRKEDLFFEICKLAEWDKRATLAYREPWFACKNSLLEKLPSDLKTDAFHRGASFAFWNFSRQIYGMALLQQTQILGTGSFQDGEIVIHTSVLSSQDKCPFSEASFPLCADWNLHLPANTDDAEQSITVWYKSFPIYGQWLKENGPVVSALLDPEHKVLSKVDDDVMGKLFDGIWIGEADLQKGSHR